MLSDPRHLAGFRQDRRGAAAAEFAVVLPVMLAIYAGMSELSHAIDEWRKLTLLARTVADLTSQGDTANPVDASVMKNIFDAAPRVMRPFDTSNVAIRVSAIGYDPVKLGLSPWVCSSVSNDSTALAPRKIGADAGLTLPAGYPLSGARYVLAEVRATYTPMIGAAVLKTLTKVDTINLSASFPWPTRGGKTYGANLYTEIILPDTTSQKACDGSAP